MELNLIKPEKINLFNHPILNEKWVQDIIAKDPSIFGLGELMVKDKERIHPKAGRLDLLLQDPDSERRYEVEVQLGRVDESHIIRTIEYWDIERKRYPQFDHCAVIIAEDITSRFLNVISLLNGSVPIIAIQIGAYKHADNCWLNFTKVLDELSVGNIEDDNVREVTDRKYWESHGTYETVAMADELLALINTFSGDYSLNYTKFYIGLTKNNQPDNFVIFRPKKSSIRVEFKIEQNDGVTKMIEEADLDLMEYDERWGKYRIKISKQDLIKNKELIKQLLKMSFDQKWT